ncbi:MAG: CoA-binding protein, partial [Desulfurococcales archaeon]|nr:CoA-binding protein [Desulfurococcales archaeon]
MKALFRPKSIAVVGASRQPGKIGYEILANIIKYGFKGKVYPINPKADNILGLKAYPSISAIGEPVDLVVVSVPAKYTIDVIEDAGKAGAKA